MEAKVKEMEEKYEAVLNMTTNNVQNIQIVQTNLQTQDAKLKTLDNTVKNIND